MRPMLPHGWIERMRSHHSQRSTRQGWKSSTGPQLRVLAAIAVVAAAGLLAGATDEDTTGAATDAGTEVAAVYEEFTEAIEAGALDTILELTSGPALAFYQRTQHFAAATGETDLFPNLHWEPGEVTLTDDATAVVDGAIVWGVDEETARELTQFEFRHDGQRWLLDSFLRNGIAIGDWVTPGSDTPIDSGPVTVELVSTFADLTCTPGVESPCPDFLRNFIALDLLVENRSDGDLQPGSLTLPDGTESPAWLETPSGGAYPLFDAAVAGFPPRTTVPVSGLFAAADDLAEGGVLHLVLQTADGTDHPLDVPVAPHPHDWTVDPDAGPSMSDAAGR